MKLSDAHFGIKMYDFNHKELVEVNLFNFPRIKWAVANYVAFPDRRLKGDWLPQCFFDCCGKSEFEFLVSELGGGEPQKVDIWSMYVLPNRKVLEEIVKSISKTSCQEYIREERKRRARYRLTK